MVVELVAVARRRRKMAGEKRSDILYRLAKSLCQMVSAGM
jgi:hypothetical protein